MSAHTALIERFYDAFKIRDARTMGACYHPEARFADPVFPQLDAEAARAMWAMLCERGRDLRIEYRDVSADNIGGRAHWEAWYTFSGTGRKVHNVIDAEFEFRDGLILSHVDRFDLHRWAGQALGLAGRLLGGSSLLQRKVQRQAADALARYRQAPNR